MHDIRWWRTTCETWASPPPGCHATSARSCSPSFASTSMPASPTPPRRWRSGTCSTRWAARRRSWRKRRPVRHRRGRPGSSRSASGSPRATACQALRDPLRHRRHRARRPSPPTRPHRRSAHLDGNRRHRHRRTGHPDPAPLLRHAHLRTLTSSSDVEPQGGAPTPIHHHRCGIARRPGSPALTLLRSTVRDGVLVGRSGACRARQSRPVGPRRPGPHATPPLALRRCCPRGRRAARSSRG